MIAVTLICAAATTAFLWLLSLAAREVWCWLAGL
jgi:hypothetical protein